MIERLGDDGMMVAFEALTVIQPPEYRAWQDMRSTPIERVRVILMQARAGLADSLFGLR